MELAVSIDLGGTSTKIALVNRQGKILSRNQFPTWEGNSKNVFFDLLFAHIHQVTKEVPFDNIQGIGIDTPSCVPDEGIIKSAVNLPFQGEVPIVDLLKMKFQKPVYLCNDATAAALGEGKFGNAKGMKNFAVVTLGTGLGCGIIVNDQVLTGKSGLSAELGHVIAKRNGRLCGCGKFGCLETYVSAPGIKRNFLSQLAKTNQESSLNGVSIKDLTAKEIGDAAKKGDVVAKKAYEQAGKILGENLSNFVHLFEPEAIILAGGVAEVGSILFEPTIRALVDNLLPNYLNEVKIYPSGLGENEAALLGASTLVFN